MLGEPAVGLLVVFTGNVLSAHKTNHKDAYKILRRNREESTSETLA
jgi:hypothetical protein